MSDPGPILLLIFFFLLISFFTTAEVAYLRPAKFSFDLGSKRTSWSERLTDWLLDHRLRVAAICLVGRLIAMVGSGVILASWLYYRLWQNPELSAIGYSAIAVIVAAIILFLSRWLIPKVFIGIYGHELLQAFALPLTVFYYLFYPLVQFVTGFNRFVTGKVARVNYSKEKPAFAATNLEEHIRRSADPAQTEEMPEIDTRILENALEFKTVKVRECMVPRTEIEAVEISDSIEDLRQLFIESGHSKILVYKETIDNIIGYCHQLSLFRKPAAIEEILTPVTVIPENMLANELLVKFIKDHRSMALVVDEFGGTSGIVTVEDVIEEIFGEIEDEYDKDELVEQVLPEPNTYLFSARHEIDYLNEKYGFELPEGDYETLGGFILSVNEDIPNAGDVIPVPPFTITVLTMDENRINTVRFTMHPEQTEA
ncbi:HlyC/CorC family transporter [Adhaeribacter sp. BT258]|uniref:HlyC/CorC family transporter n=1 Tax=Adhaeribacter terrigena TaxID=2793070 RepID=A0ABS1C2B5_9BACT|nr:hemolysin family protein [Adhaeribacter terrigena]MBK0403539.1 HlyC/CorC family transporter [Adhaeribacter terrigena]